MNVYRDQDQPIRAEVGERFAIELEGNPTTGYEWDLKEQGGKVRLVDRRTAVPGRALGGAGVQTLTLEPVEAGEAVILLQYKRRWDSTAAQEKSFRIHVSKTR